MRTSLLIVVALSIAGAPACASSTTGRPAAGAHAERAVAPPGTRATARLESSLGARVSRRGDLVRARLVTPMRSESGALVAPAGALVHLRVTDADAGPAPSVRLRFETIETVHGPAPLRATLAHDQCGVVPMRVEEIREPALGYDAILYPAAPRAQAIGGGPTEHAEPGEAHDERGELDEREEHERAPIDEGAPDGRAGEIMPPAGTPIDLVLTAPLAVPLAPRGRGPERVDETRAPDLWPPTEQGPTSPQRVPIGPPPEPQRNSPP